MAHATGRSQGLSRSVVALPGAACRPNCGAAKSHPERRNFPHEQRQSGEVAGNGAGPGKGCRHGKNSGGLGAISRLGGDPEASGGVVASRNTPLEDFRLRPDLPGKIDQQWV